MPVPPDAVWDALADHGAYGYWVVGSKAIRDADAAWPSTGARFQHTIGVCPRKARDHSSSLEGRGPRLLRIGAKGRPLGTARITLRMTPRGNGALVRTTETPDGPTAILALNPLVHLLTN